jgi:hypothetical protein
MPHDQWPKPKAFPLLPWLHHLCFFSFVGLSFLVTTSPRKMNFLEDGQQPK